MLPFLLSMIDVEQVRSKIGHLVQKMSISKTKLGEILGGKPKDDPRVKINRASRFLSGAKKNISLQEVNRLAEFFDRPVEWLLFDESYVLSSPNKKTSHSEKPIEQVAQNLREMGFDEDFISAQMTQLKAMKVYNSQENK